MKEYQPQTAELLNLGIYLLENGKNGIKCFISDEKNRLVAEIETDHGIDKLAYFMKYPTGDESVDFPLLEKRLVNEIKIYYGLEKFIDVITEHHRNETHQSHND